MARFILDRHWWGKAEHFDLRLEYPDSLWDLALFKDPRQGGVVYGVHSICRDKKWLNKEGAIQPGEVGNPSKNFIAHVKILDRGTWKLIRERKKLKIVELNGKSLKGTYRITEMDRLWSFSKVKTAESKVQRYQRQPTSYGFYPRPFGRYGYSGYPRFGIPRSDEERAVRHPTPDLPPRGTGKTYPDVFEAKKQELAGSTVWVVEKSRYTQIWRIDPKQAETIEVTQTGLPTDRKLPRATQGFFGFNPRTEKWMVNAVGFKKPEWNLKKIEGWLKEFKPWTLKVVSPKQSGEDLERIKNSLLEKGYTGDIDKKAMEILARLPPI